MMNMLPQSQLHNIAAPSHSLAMSKPGLYNTLITSNNSRWYEEKLEASRRKLAAGYERELFIKRQHAICILQPHQIPSPPPPAALHNHRKTICKQQKQQKKLNATSYNNKPARSTSSLLNKWRPEAKVFPGFHGIAAGHSPKDSSKNAKSQHKPRAVHITATQKRRELILHNILEHTAQGISAPVLPATFSGNSNFHDLQHINSSSDTSQTTNVAELQKKDTPVADLKGCSPPQIIRKSMFKFVIKLGGSGAGA